MRGPGCVGRRRAPRRHAFTLVELLAVMGIISVLTALLLPAVQSARAEARAVQCQSNVRQLTLGVMAYAAESRGKHPPNVTAPSPGEYWYDDKRVGSFIPQPFGAGLPEPTVWACPDDELARRSYAMNNWASCRFDGMNSTVPPSLRPYAWGPNHKHAAKMVLLVEAWSGKGSNQTGFYADPTVGLGLPYFPAGRVFGGGGGMTPFNAGRWRLVNSELTYMRHRRGNGPGTATQPRGRIVMSFGDGHVELMSSGEIVDHDSGVLSGRVYWSPVEAR